MRKAIVAGQFYEASREALSKEIENCFKHKLGSGLPKVPLPEKKIFGVIAPHAGYQYSGPCAAHVYKELTSKTFPETFILLGPNHSGHGKTFFALSLEDFETPFGIVKNDKLFSEALIKAASSQGLQQDETAHAYEHSIEVQLPFLQFISRLIKKEKGLRIVPIVISTLDLDKCIAVASTIAEIAREQGKQVCVVASSDMTHYGSAYGFLPFPPNQNTKNNLYALDKKSINYILKLDNRNFYSEAIKTTICGTAPIVMAIEICKALGASKARLLKYYTSGDIIKDYSNAVGYASIVLE